MGTGTRVVQSLPAGFNVKNTRPLQLLRERLRINGGVGRRISMRMDEEGRKGYDIKCSRHKIG